MNLNVLNEEGGYSLTRADRFSHEGAAVTEGLVPAELTEAGKTAGILNKKSRWTKTFTKIRTNVQIIPSNNITIRS